MTIHCAKCDKLIRKGQFKYRLTPHQSKIVKEQWSCYTCYVKKEMKLSTV